MAGTPSRDSRPTRGGMGPLGRRAIGWWLSFPRARGAAPGWNAGLKVPFVDEENRSEADALLHYGGVGAVRLYETDRASGALLLERLTPGLSLAAHPHVEEIVDIACGVLRRIWHPPHPGRPFPRVRDLAAEWADEFPARHDRHGRPFPALVDCAAGLARDLAGGDGSEVVVNRDAHAGNILSAEREPWLLIDPKPLVGERSFDAGYLVLDRLGEIPSPTRAEALVDRLANGLGVERERVWAWAFVRAVENAAWALDIDASPAIHLAKATALQHASSVTATTPSAIPTPRC